MMTSRERVMEAFAHREADRVPLGEMHIMSQVASDILGREAITVNSGWGVKKQIDMILEGRRDEYVERKGDDIFDIYDKLDLDLITIELDPPKGAGAAYRNVTDSGWDEVNEATGTWAKYIFDSDSDTELEVDSWIKQGEFEALERHADLLEDAGCGVDESRFDSTKYIIEKNKKQRAVMVKIPNLIPTGLSWTPLFFESMHIRPELAQRLCDAYLKKGLALAEYMITLGADVLLVCSDWAYNSGPMASPAMIREYWIPQIRAVADLCHSNGVFLMKHTDGNIMSFIDDFMTMGIDAYQGIEPNAGMSLKTVKDLYGDRVLLMGNVDCAQTLPFGTKEQIVEETKNCLRDGGPGGGYILASCNTIQTCVPADNYLTMIEAAHKFNRYPIMI